MHKLIAILRDSYREATATWVIPAMAVLTLLLVALVASIGFKPVTLADALTSKCERDNFTLKLNPQFEQPQFRVENVVPSDPQRYWKSDYELDLVAEATPRGFEQLESAFGNAALPLTPRRAANYVSSAAPYLASAKGTAAPARGDAPAGRVERRYHIATAGTKIEDVTSWPHQPTFLFAFDWFNTPSLREGAYTIQKRLINDVGSLVVLLVGVVITAGFIPNMLQKGSLDLYISKPIGRSELLVYKYLGGLIFVAVLMTGMVGSIYLALGARTGFWSPRFLLIIPLMTFYFAVLYAVSTLAAVLTRSTLMAILATLLAWGAFFLVGWGHDLVAQADTQVKEVQARFRGANAEGTDPGEADAGTDEAAPRLYNPLLKTALAALYAVSPRTYDLDDRMIEAIARGVLTDFEIKQKRLDQPRPSWGATVGVSLAFIAACLGLACWRVSTRDG